VRTLVFFSTVCSFRVSLCIVWKLPLILKQAESYKIKFPFLKSGFKLVSLCWLEIVIGCWSIIEWPWRGLPLIRVTKKKKKKKKGNERQNSWNKMDPTATFDSISGSWRLCDIPAVQRHGVHIFQAGCLISTTVNISLPGDRTQAASPPSCQRFHLALSYSLRNISHQSHLGCSVNRVL
jgi:hypothetical protein